MDTNPQSLVRGGKPWDAFKKAFFAWEGSTAGYLEALLRRPSLLEPAAHALTAVTRVKRRADTALASWWRLWGLPTRAEQERLLHAVHQLESQLLDLEETLGDLAASRRSDAGRDARGDARSED